MSILISRHPIEKYGFKTSNWKIVPYLSSGWNIAVYLVLVCILDTAYCEGTAADMYTIQFHMKIMMTFRLRRERETNWAVVSVPSWHNYHPPCRIFYMVLQIRLRLLQWAILKYIYSIVYWCYYGRFWDLRLV